MRRRRFITRPRRNLATLALTALALAGPAAADALDDVPGVKIITYPVSGTDAASLRRSIISQRRIDQKTGQAFDGFTHWQVSWRWSGDGQGGCDLATVRVDFHLEVTLPALEHPERLSADVLQRWNAYLFALRRHEAGHARHAYDGVEDIRRAVSQGDCAHANDRGRAVVQRMNRFDLDYDRDTRHGVLQGTILP